MRSTRLEVEFVELGSVYIYVVKHGYEYVMHACRNEYML